jgi:hypothetical protein
MDNFVARKYGNIAANEFSAHQDCTSEIDFHISNKCRLSFLVLGLGLLKQRGDIFYNQSTRLSCFTI